MKMNSNNSESINGPISIELASKRTLARLQETSDILFTGKLSRKEEGGFKQLYDLPSTSVLGRLDNDIMNGTLFVRIRHFGWLCNRDSGWVKTTCALSSSTGVLFVYTKENKGGSFVAFKRI
jgi:hypothetical protein